MKGSHASTGRSGLDVSQADTPDTPDADLACEAGMGVSAANAIGTQHAAENAKWWQAVRALLIAQFDPAAAQNVRRDALAVFSIRVMSAALLFVSQIILARWIGASGYGLYVALWSAVLVAGGLSHMGLGTAMMRLVPQYRASNDFEHLRGLLIGGRFIALAGGLTVAAAGGLLLWLSDKGGQSDFVLAAVLALACLPAYALTEAQDGLGRGQGWTLESIAPPYILRPALVLFAAAASYALAFPSTASTAMMCALAATWITAIVQSVLVQRQVAKTVSPGPSAFQLFFWLKVSLPLLAVSGSELVLQNADVLLLNALRPPEEVGIYYAAAKTTCLALFVHYAVGSAYSGRFATAGALGDHDGLVRLTREAVAWTFWPSLAVTAVVLITGPFLLGLFGKDFESAYPAMFILSAGLLARAATGPSEFVLNMLGHQNDCARSFAIAAGVSIALNLLFIPFFGAFGAATATACAFATASGLNWRTARRKLGLNLFVLAPASGPEPSGSKNTIGRRRQVGLNLLSPVAARAAGPAALHKPVGQARADAPDIAKQELASPQYRQVVYAIVRDESGFDALHDDWNRLYSASPSLSQPFMSFDWHRHWVRHYHAGQSHPLGVQLAIVVGRRAGRVVVIWPLVTKRMAGMTYLYWMGQPVSQYGDVLVEASDTTQALLHDSWDIIISMLAPDVVTLRKVRVDAAAAPLLKDLGAVVTRTAQAPFVATGGHASFEDFEQRYSAKARKNRRRLMRRLEEKGTVDFVHARKGPEATSLVKRAIELKQAWLDARGLLSAAVHDQRFERFFSAASEGGKEPSCCLVSALKLDGHPCAILVSISGGNHIAGHIFAYDLQHEKAGAGVLLLEECLRHAVSSGHTTFDLLAPGDAYKYDWCDQQVEVNDWALATSLRGQLFTRLYLTHLREKAKRTARLLPVPVRKLIRRAVQGASIESSAAALVRSASPLPE